MVARDKCEQDCWVRQGRVASRRPTDPYPKQTLSDTYLFPQASYLAFSGSNNNIYQLKRIQAVCVLERAHMH